MSIEKLKLYMQLSEMKQTKMVKRLKKSTRLEVVQELRLYLLTLVGFAGVMPIGELQDELRKAIQLMEQGKPQPEP